MWWLSVIISAYFLFAVTSLIDNYLLSGKLNPKSYSFYIGVLGILSLAAIPFVSFSMPAAPQFLLSILAGAFYVIGLFWLYTGLENFEPSRIIPAIGAVLPLFTFILVWALQGKSGMLGLKEILAFALLISGSVLISLKKEKKISLESLKVSAASAFFFSLVFVFSKYIYKAQPFWQGFIWMRVGAFLTALCFLIPKKPRKEILSKKASLPKKSLPLFLLNQGIGAGAFVLQNFAIALVTLAYLPFLNALQGIQYVFLFLLALLFAKKIPKLSEEKLVKKLIIKKVISIGLIVFGLVIFSL